MFQFAQAVCSSDVYLTDGLASTNIGASDESVSACPIKYCMFCTGWFRLLAVNHDKGPSQEADSFNKTDERYLIMIKNICM